VNLGAPELLIVLVIILLVFGGTRLPKLARSLGQAQKEFKTGLSASEEAAAERERAAIDAPTDAPIDRGTTDRPPEDRRDGPRS
jgi:sec-independent protein translocase protein TatA